MIRSFWHMGSARAATVRRAGLAISTAALAGLLAAPALAQSKPDPKKQQAKPAASKTTDKGKKPDPKSSARPAAAAAAGGAAAAAAAARPAAAKPALVGTFGDWGVYSANAGKAKTCYALGQPKDRLPASLKRDPGYVFISSRPGEGVRNEISIVMGFDVKPTDLRAEIGNQSFEMVAKGSNLWVKNAAEEGQMLEAMKKGSRLVVKASSVRGNASTDSYSLAGIAQAVDRAAKECQ
jgi:hypothetical protein